MKNFKKDIKFKKIKNFLSKKEVQIYNECFFKSENIVYILKKE